MRMGPCTVLLGALVGYGCDALDYRVSRVLRAARELSGIVNSVTC